MPTIIDSLFLELGIDVSKFSKDQANALAKISQFEAKAKKSGKGAGDAIKTVGDAFRDLAKESRIGASGAGIDQLAKKLTMLGKSAQVAGVFGGAAAEGLGMLLSPAALGIAAVGLLGKGMWDLNKNMSAANATMYRQSQLSSMNADNLWAWGEAAKTVGANPQDITGGISSVQGAIQGMMIGAGDATPQLVALSRLGLGWNAQSGLDDDQVTKMFTKVHQLAAAKGYKNLGGLKALTGPVMNDAMFALATSPNFNPATMQGQIKASEPGNLGDILQKSLSSQEVLGKLGIKEDILKEVAYGGEQGLMSASVDLLTRILDGIIRIADYFTHPGKIVSGAKSAWNATVDAVSRGIDQSIDLVNRPSTKMSKGMQILMDNGVSESDAAAIVGSAAQESSMNPFARNGSHAGLFQLNKARQANFAKFFGYSIGSSAVSADQQFKDQMLFSIREPEYMAAASAMAKAKGLLGKTSAFMDLDERPGDNSLSQRFANAQAAMRMADVAGMVTRAVQSTVTSETNIGDIHVHTPSTDPAAHADAVRKGIATHPLVSPIAQGTISLATRGMAG